MLPTVNRLGVPIWRWFVYSCNQGHRWAAMKAELDGGVPPFSRCATCHGTDMYQAEVVLDFDAPGVAEVEELRACVEHLNGEVVEILSENDVARADVVRLMAELDELRAEHAAERKEWAELAAESERVHPVAEGTDPVPAAETRTAPTPAERQDAEPARRTPTVEPLTEEPGVLALHERPKPTKKKRGPKPRAVQPNANGGPGPTDLLAQLAADKPDLGWLPVDAIVDFLPEWEKPKHARAVARMALDRNVEQGIWSKRPSKPKSRVSVYRPGKGRTR